MFQARRGNARTVVIPVRVPIATMKPSQEGGTRGIGLTKSSALLETGL